MSLDEDDSSLLWTAAAFSTLFCIVLSVLSQQRRRRHSFLDHHAVPMAKGGNLPFLGHALAYQCDPPGFLTEQEQLVGKVFQVNLAGRHMIVIGSDPKAMKQIATLPESMLSARQAVAEIGFEYTLGHTSVYRGTDWHKRILRNEILAKDKLEAIFLPTMHQALADALEKEVMLLSKSSSSTFTKENETVVVVPDLFVLVRRCMLRSMLNVLVGSVVLLREKEDDILLTEMMTFQDGVEDATAKAAVLPRFVALPLVLWPMARARKRLQRRLATRIAAAWNCRSSSKEKNNDGWGPWLRVLYEETNHTTNVEEAAELIVGLMFAAHKNPAIGAAQSFCYLHTRHDDDDDDTNELQHQRHRAAVQREATRLLQTEQPITLSDLLQATTLRRCVLETMRLTAHSLGALRLAREGFVLETDKHNYIIHRGDTIAVSHITTHTDPQGVWGPNAPHYQPNRTEWVATTRRNDDDDTSISIASPVDEYKLTTFSHGLHKCPGERIALIVMELMLALLLDRNAQFVLEDKSSIPPISFERATLAQRDGPVPITIAVVR